MIQNPFLETIDHIKLLNSELNRRQEIHAKYSLRDFANDLGLDPSALSRILRAKQIPTLELARSIAAKLELSPTQLSVFLLSVGEVRIMDLMNQLSDFLESALSPSDVLASMLERLKIKSDVPKIDIELYSSVVKNLPGYAAVFSPTGLRLTCNTPAASENTVLAISVDFIDWKEQLAINQPFEVTLPGTALNVGSNDLSLRLSPIRSAAGSIVGWLATQAALVSAESSNQDQTKLRQKS